MAISLRLSFYHTQFYLINIKKCVLLKCKKKKPSHSCNQVQRVLKVLEKPFCTQESLELPGQMVRLGSEEAQKKDEEAQREAEEDVTGAENRVIVSYDSKPPAWATKICVT